MSSTVVLLIIAVIIVLAGVGIGVTLGTVAKRVRAKIPKILPPPTISPPRPTSAPRKTHPRPAARAVNYYHDPDPVVCYYDNGTAMHESGLIY